MYPEFETRTSYKYLKQVISALNGPICILGGWAAFLHVNQNFQRAQGRPYLGSRDIDLGFHLDNNASVKQMKESVLAKSLDILQNKLKFEPVSFRLLKEIHTETEEEISNNQIIPAHFIFPMYVDVLVDNIPKKFKEIFHFQPADEPLLSFVFKDKKYRDEIKELSKRLWLPKPELIIATKLNALTLRDKEHKKIKDLCDIFALLWYSKEMPQELCNKMLQFLKLQNIRKIIKTITQKDYQKISIQLAHTPEEIRRVMELMNM